MKSKKIVLLLCIATLLVSVLASCGMTSNNSGNNNVTANTLSDLSFDSLDLNDSPGVGFELVYESANSIIFFGDFGLFGYDLSEQKMSFAVDFVKAYGEKGSVQGSYGTYVEVSSDGQRIALTYTDPDAPEVKNEAYYIDIPTMTYQRGEYQPLDDIFVKETAIGYVRPGGKISSTVYVCGEKEWAVFDGYEAPK